MEQQTPIPHPPPKSRMKAREGQKRAIFPSLIWGGGGGGLWGFPFILSKIVGPVVTTLDSAIHRINHYPVDKY